MLELNATKDKFFAIIAHDLKNPIGSFKSITEVLNDEYEAFSEEDKKDFILMLKNSSSNIQELLENLLTWSKSQRNKITFNPEYQYISQIIKHNFALLEPAAHKKNIKLIDKTDSSLVAYCDGNLINTVMRNLSTNAVKFTKENGEVSISSNIVNDIDSGKKSSSNQYIR